VFAWLWLILIYYERTVLLTGWLTSQVNRANNAANYISISLLGVIWAVRITFPLQDIIVALATVGIKISLAYTKYSSQNTINPNLYSVICWYRTSVRDSIGFHKKISILTLNYPCYHQSCFILLVFLHVIKFVLSAS